MKNNDRLIQFFDILIKGKTTTRDINGDIHAPRTLDELMAEFEILRELNAARYKFRKDAKQEYILADMHEKDNCWVLLINIIDADAAHPLINKLGGNDSDRSVISLDDDTGIESSSHIIIYKNTDIANKHLVLYERNSNLPFSKVVSFINRLAKTSSKLTNIDKYRKPHPSGEEGAFINTHCSLAYYGHPSDEFFDELANGVLSGIRLTSNLESIKGYDAQIHRDLIGHEIKMSIDKISVRFSGGNVAHLKKAVQYANSLDAPFVRIQFKDSTGASHSADINSDTGGLSNNDEYIKKSKITDFGNTLQTGFPIIHDKIVQKMRELLT